MTERERAAGNLPDGYEYRLPTEAQWEYAGRAGTTTRFSYGDDPGYDLADNYIWHWDNSQTGEEPQTHPIGEKLPNPWGLYDMHGNLWEWCSDWYESLYAGEAQVDPVGPTSGVDRVTRGGSWFDGADWSRSANRCWRSPVHSDFYIGFRPALVSLP